MKKLLLLLSLQHLCLSQNYVNNDQQYCKYVLMDNFILKDEDRVSKRNSEMNYLTTNSKTILNYFQKQSEMELLSGGIIVIIVPIILAVLGLITLVFSILFFFILLQASDSTKKKLKIQWFFTLGISFLFLIFFIAFLVSSTQINSSVNTINCSVSQIPV